MATKMSQTKSESSPSNSIIDVSDIVYTSERVKSSTSNKADDSSTKNNEEIETQSKVKEEITIGSAIEHISDAETNAPIKPKTPKSAAGSAILSIEKATPTGKSSSKITYLTMATQCIRHLADRSGSSFPAIYKSFQSLFDKPDTPHIRQNLNKSIKQGLKAGRFVKVRNSFKINSAWTKKEKEVKKRKEREKKKLEEKRKKVSKESKDKKTKEKLEEEKRLKRKKDLQSMTEEERKEALQKERIKLERAKVQEQKQKEAKILAEKIRKRKFPMEDLELIKEDRLLHVKPPHAKTPPALPLLVPDYPTLNYSVSRRGVICDVFQIFHFFRGDVGWRRSETVEFKLGHMFHCCQEIVNGNTKHNGTMPPLIVHLFLIALHHLTTESVNFPELEKLGEILNPLNWSEILRHYIDFMQEHSISALPSNVLRDYTESNIEELPPHYYGYLGPPKCTLAKAHAKLSKQESYMLTVEECMCLLRALCDDILANSTELEDEISSRMDEMYELTKTKKTAESNWRKIKLAYEGPKYPSRKKKEISGDKDNNPEPSEEGGKEEDGKLSEGNAAKDVSTEKVSTLKLKTPKPTKKEYEDAEKARQRAIDNHDKGFRKLIARTEPLGYDRNHCGVYHFYHDPENVYLETLPLSKKDNDRTETQNRTWRVISCKSLFDDYVATLDIRGIREFHLDDNLIYKGYVRRHLYDDIRIKNMIEAKKKEEEALQKRYETAKEVCADSNRRSGRLVHMQQQELQEIQDEINIFNAINSESAEVNEKQKDLKILTGYELLREFEKKYTAEWKQFRSSTLWTQNQYGGVLGPLVFELLEIEKQCNKLVPWDRKDETRNEWIDNLKLMKTEWENEHSLVFGFSENEEINTSSPLPKIKAQDERDEDESSKRSLKRRRSRKVNEADSKLNPTQERLKLLKRALLQLESWVMKISGKLAKSADDNFYLGILENREISDDIENKHKAWKKRIRDLDTIPTRRAAAVRDELIAAIASAQKVHLKEVANELRSCLKLFRPNAAHAAKVAALKVLDKFGGYQFIDDDETSLEDDDPIMKDVSVENPLTSSGILSDDALSLFCHLDVEDNIEREEWVESVKSCKTLSRLSALVCGFAKKANKVMKEIRNDRDALIGAIEFWLSENKPGRRKKKKKIKSYIEPMPTTGFWVHSNRSEDYVLAKVDVDYPWWPARVCFVKDDSIRYDLESLNRNVFSLVGEEKLFVLKEDEVKPYTNEVTEEDTSKLDEETALRWKECVTLVEQILCDKKNSLEKRKKRNPEACEEEKKSIDL